MKYLLDTDIIIDFLDAKQDAVRKLYKILPLGNAMSVITFVELLRGVYKTTNPTQHRKELNELISLNAINILPVDINIGIIYAKNYALLEKEGKILAGFDLLIASTALLYKLTLITNNIRHFSRISGLKLYEK